MIITVAKNGAIAIALLAIVLKSIAVVKPSIFFKIPNVGFIFHTILTGIDPPPYFTFDAWSVEDSKTWLRDGDLVVASGAKSGTTWMLYCAHQIRMKGSNDADDLFEDISLATPWPELLQDPDLTWAETKNRLNTTILADGSKMKDKWDNPRFPFHVWKSHATPESPMPIKERPNVKFFAMSRNGLDVVSSMVPFFNQHSEYFRKAWGGFPPADSGSPEENAVKRLEELSPGGMLEHLYFGYVKAWWPYRNEPNVFLAHYSDVIRDLPGHVAKMAKFVGIELNKQEMSTVVERCGMAHMKTIKHKFLYTLPLSENNSLAGTTIMKSGDDMIRKGGIGGGKVTFSEEQKAAWAKAEGEVFGHDPALLKWAREGGLYK
mmetsp:Transcript_25550/g.37743  ORF Transcript_25550/g.37743 Transcript_25550/m.37743 type:complete len:376 (-) Transcript_25550:78-1205(-)